ncbi:MAG: hypothetical protein NT077_01370 [Candidatus Taylorbacteria bacterium]|nr:hypothetical protein [Candidatus Taylorbacteria bacterium]
MKRYFVFSLLTLVACFSSGALNTFAQETTSSPTKINARILPTVWYSSLSVNDGDSIKIYAGVQNNSGIDFSGTASFLVDDKEISKVSFSSTADSLKDISTNWAADPGSHNVQVKISTSLATDKTLVSYESDKSAISITRKITTEVVGETALNTATSIVAKADDIASVLADKIESFKKLVRSDNTDVVANSIGGSTGNIVNMSTNALKGTSGIVLGTSTSPISDSGGKGLSKMDSVFNMAMDLLAFLIRHWIWTLSGLVVIYLIFKIGGRGRR